MSEVATFQPIGAGSSIWTPGARRPPEERLPANLPLKYVDLRTPLRRNSLATGETWPPTYLQERTRRMSDLIAASRGDVSRWVQDEEARRIVPDLGGVTCETMAGVVWSALNEPKLAAPLYSHTTYMQAIGRGYLARIDQDLVAFSPEHVYHDREDPDTVWVVEPQNGGSERSYSLDADELLVTAINAEMVMQQIVNLDGMSLGEGGEVEDYSGGWGYVNRFPVRLGWGRSAVEPIIPLMAAIGCIMSGTAFTVDEHSAPTVILPFSKQQGAEIVSGIEGMTLEQWGSREMQQAASDLWRNATITVPNGQFQPTVLSWNGNLAAAFQLIEAMKAEVRLINSIPAALEKEGAPGMSGASIRQQHLGLYWRARPLWLETTALAEELLGRPIDAGDPFGEGSATSTTPDATPVEATGQTAVSDGGSMNDSGMADDV